MATQIEGSRTSLSMDPLLLETPQQKKERPSSERILRAISKQWTNAFRQASLDLRSVSWNRVGRWTPFALWSMMLLGVFIFLTIYGLGLTQFGFTACRPDNSFNPILDEYSAWAGSTFFEINLGFGNLSFTEAKVVDISWDIIIGRGGQTLMAVLSWHAFKDYVTTSMEFAPITYAVYFDIFLQDEPSISSSFRVIRTFIQGQGLKSKLSTVFMAFSMVFLISWPTIAGAMTGYTTLVKAFVLDQNNNYVPYSDFRPIAYMIHDGGRINLTSNYPVHFWDTINGEVLLLDGLMMCFECGYRETLSESVSNYVASYGFFGLNNTMSIWEDTPLQSPVLNISAFYLRRWYDFYGSEWYDSEQKMPFADPANMAYTYSNQTYPLTYVRNNGRCQPVEDRFKWGFSFIQLFLAIVLLISWTIGIYTLWLKAQFLLPLQGQVEVPKRWRSVLILAQKMNGHLQDAGIDPHVLTDKLLKKEIKGRLQGGSISFDTPLTRSQYSFSRGAKQWLRREWRLCVMLLSILIVDLIFFFTIPDVYFSLFFWMPFSSFLFFGVIFAKIVGSTIGSRLIMIFIWAVCGFPISWVVFRFG